MNALGNVARPIALHPAAAAPVAHRLPSSAATYDFGPSDLCPFCEITPQYPAGQQGLHWHDHWKAVGVREYIATPILAAIAVYLELFVEPENTPDWNRPVLFDTAARNALRLESKRGRDTAQGLSDVLFHVSWLHPLVIDNFLVAWWANESPRVAWQMFIINAQAEALTLAVTNATKRLTSRQRPWVDPCDADPSGDSCGEGGRFRSFFSGHSATTATGAGLICAHHTQLKLYRNALLDSATCVAAVLGTAVTGAMRVASDNHWASDVLTGHLVGYLSGYLMPTLLYYREFRLTPHEHEPRRELFPTWAVLPWVSPGAAQLNLVGQF